MRTSIGNTFSSIEIPVDNDTDLLEFLARVKDEIGGLIVAQLGERGALKFYLTVKTQLSRTSTDGLEQITTPYFCSIPVIILQSTDIGDEIDIAGHRIKELLATHESQGSGFKLDFILDCQLHVATYDKIGGSSYLPLPKFVQIKRATINIKNDDLNCFQYSLLYTKLQPAVNPERVYHYKKHHDDLNMTGIRTPVEITQLKKFEQQNPDFSVNVYALNSRKASDRNSKLNLFPLYNTKERQRKYHTNLLLITANGNSHYVIIKSLSRLLAGRTAENNKAYICKFCLYSFTKQSALDAHENACSEHAAVTAEYPAEPLDILRFKNFGHTLEVPFVIYADFESILEPGNDDVSKSTRKLNKHVPCGFACLTVSSCEKYNNEQVVVYSGEDAMEKLFQHIHMEQLRINEILRVIVPIEELTPEQIRDYRNAKTCFNCGVEFSADQDDPNYAKNRDHNHMDGKYIGPACTRCNLLRKYKQATRPKKNKPATYEIPIFFHNLKGYDSHLLLEHFPALSTKERVNCIATNFEQFLTFSYRGLKFVDSYQFLKASLSTLAENLKKSGEEKFVHTRRHFPEHFDIVTRKGVYPYSYMDSFDRFEEKQLPSIECFYNDLSDMPITESEYEHAQAVWRAFDMTSMKQYHDTYLVTDIVILADIMSEFSRVCMRDYGLDPKHYISLPSFSWDFMFFKT